jgi:aryl-alcohol dehydrogenase-like predicted oxidoreductase
MDLVLCDARSAAPLVDLAPQNRAHQSRHHGRPEHIRETLEGSLRRLRLERIDLYQLHRLDPQVPLEESVGTMAELRDEG